MSKGSEIPPKELRALFNAAMWRELADALSLSPRELEVAQAVFHDLPRKRIAANLKLRPDTIRTYIDRVYRKAGVGDEVALVECLVGLALAAQAKKTRKKPKKARKSSTTSLSPKL